ncbi:MAG: hypothetical protein SO093_09715, partial [Desulfovibrio sp.]|uniref:hypothetical protein n=1 Tax=Desulfovibrio sp. TaxID=885 RepID=UPI002A82411F
QGEARYVPTAHQAHHENLFVSWDEITTPFKIKKHAGHPLNVNFKVFQIDITIFDEDLVL